MTRVKSLSGPFSQPTHRDNPLTSAVSALIIPETLCVKKISELGN